MTQVRFPWVKWRSCWIDGNATFTIVVSSTIISCAMHTTRSDIQRRRSALAERDDSDERWGIKVRTVDWPVGRW